MTLLHGAVAASITPLRDGGSRLDDDAIGPLVERYVAAGLDGLLLLGTTGEGILLRRDERERFATAVIGAVRDSLKVCVHCGAQSTAESAALADHAANAGADAVAAIAPPYFTLGPDAILRHFTAIATTCAPTPFYVYEFAARSGYAVPIEVILRLRDSVSNFVGMKVSDAPFERFRPYLIEGLDVFVGPEDLIHAGLAAGARGAVSGLAAGVPEVVARIVREPTDEAATWLGALRASLDRLPFQAAMKALVALKGVPLRDDCRAPLRGLTPEERTALEREASTLGSPLAEALSTDARR